MEKLVIAGKEFSSRLFLGTGKFKSNEAERQPTAQPPPLSATQSRELLTKGGVICQQISRRSGTFCASCPRCSRFPWAFGTPPAQKLRARRLRHLRATPL